MKATLEDQNVLNSPAPIMTIGMLGDVAPTLFSTVMTKPMAQVLGETFPATVRHTPPLLR